MILRASILAAALVALITASALAVTTLGATTADAGSCADKCRAKHNSCRINTKGVGNCDAALAQCMKRCRAR